MKTFRKLWCLTALLATAMFFLAGFDSTTVSATNTPQALPFSQNWGNTGLITANDDWSGVPGVVGFLGDFDAGATTAVDPRTLLTPFAINAVDVIANQTSVAITNGGVAEFDGIANAVVALNGSGTADAPHIIVYLNTTGLGGIQFACNIRDIDDTADNSIQQVDVQYRVGGAGSYASVPGGYIADASSGPSTTMSTPLNLSLPAAVNNQSQVEVRIMTTNAAGNDEWIGIDDISVTGSPFVPADAPLDFNGDGKTDYAVARNTAGQLRWYWLLNGGGGSGQMDWGLVGDTLVMEDFDGDGKDDVTVWRQALGNASGFFIFQSATNTVKATQFGVLDDDATVIGDYDGDGKADEAVYRKGASVGSQSTWFFRGSLNNPSGNITYIQWGVNGDRVAPGDYDGDGKNDFVIRRDSGSNGVWWERLSGGSVVVQTFGLSNDRVVPGDYDGDGKTDLTALRGDVGPMTWFYLPSGGGSFQQVTWGTAGDAAVQGDYDGDGKTDPAVWRSLGGGQFLALTSSGGYQSVLWGLQNDFAIGFFNRH